MEDVAVLSTTVGTGTASVPSLDLTVVILTRNEEIHIERAIQCLSNLGAEVLIVDSYSTDATVHLASKMGARVVQNAFVTQAEQFIWALSNGEISTQWIMRLDADEVCGEDLITNIKSSLQGAPSSVVAFSFNRRHIFLGKWIRFGGRYPMNLTRIWRKGSGTVEDRLMDEHVTVWGGRVVPLRGYFADENLHGIVHFTKKHADYAAREVAQMFRRDLIDESSAAPHSSGAAPSQARSKRAIKAALYDRLPFWVSSSLYFAYRYFFQLGIFDGIRGLIYHFLQGYWYRFLVGAVESEVRLAMEAASHTEEKIRIVEAITGYVIRPHKFRC